MKNRRMTAVMKRMTAVLTSVMMAFSLFPAGISVYASDKEEEILNEEEDAVFPEKEEAEDEEKAEDDKTEVDEKTEPGSVFEESEEETEEDEEESKSSKSSKNESSEDTGKDTEKDAKKEKSLKQGTEEEEETEWESGTLDPIVWVNPDSKAFVSEEDLIEEVKEREKEEDESPIATFSATSDFLSLSECGVQIRKHMAARDTEFTIYYNYPAATISSSALNTQVTLMLNTAYAHTGVGNEGDYIPKHLEDYGITLRYSGSSGAYKVTLKFAVQYYTTASQEASVTKKVDQVLDSILYPCMSDYEKVKAIYDYIIKNVSYDYDHLNDEDYHMHFTAYAALINGKAVCQGFANLFYRMALDAGLDCRIITGTSYGQAHAWNIVKIGDYYYNVDATWDSNNNTYTWFLKGTDFSNHTRASSFNTTSFNNQYPVPSSSYNVSTATSGNTSNHTYTSKVTKEATCLTEGVRTYTCTVCGTSYTEKIAASGGHNLVHIAAVAAGDAHTDTEGNIEYYKCSICGKCFTDSAGKNEISESDTITYPEGHTVRHVKATATTCTTDGNKEYWYCEDCKLYYSDANLTKTVSLSDMTIPATGHTLVFAAAKEASCDKEGNVAYYKCSVCGSVFSDEEGTKSLSSTVIPAKGHTLIHTEAKNPTTEEEGNREYWYCTVCDTYFFDAECTEPGSAEEMILPVVEHPIDLTVSISWQDHTGAPIPEEWIADPLMIELSATTTDGHRYEFIPVEFTRESGWTYTFTDVYDDVHYSIIDSDDLYIFHSDYDEKTHTLSVTGTLEIDVDFDWNEDCTACTAYFMDAGGNILAEVNCGITSVQISDPTCTEEGSIRHTAAADYFGNEVYVYEDHDGFEHDEGTTYVMDAEETAIPVLGHTPGLHIDEKAATETSDGNVEYWICDVCGAFVDAEGNEIHDVVTTWASAETEDEKTENEGGNISGSGEQYRDVNPGIGEDEGDPDSDYGASSQNTSSQAENASSEDSGTSSDGSTNEDTSDSETSAQDEEGELILTNSSDDGDASDGTALSNGTGTDSTGTNSTGTVSTVQALRTGVESHLGLIIGVAVVAVILLAVALVMRRKTKKG